MAKNIFAFSAPVWLYPGKAAWHFATIPAEVRQEIDYYHDHHRHGFGSLKVTVTCQNVSWQTSIFPDSRTKGYLLPLKKKILTELEVKVEDVLSFQIEVRSE